MDKGKREMNILNGYKTIIGGFGLVLVGISGILIRVSGNESFSEYGLSFDQGIALISAGLGILGIGHKITKFQKSMFPIFLLLLVPQCWSSEISGPKVVPPCSGLVRLSTTVDDGHVLKWEVTTPRNLDYVSYDNNTSLAFASPSKSGVISILLIDAWVEGTTPRVNTSYYDIEVRGETPQPEPSPIPPTPEPPIPTPPTPEPPKPLVPPDNLKGIAITAFVEAAKLPLSQRETITKVRDAYSSMASAIAAGTVKSEDQLKSLTKENVGNLIASIPEWNPFMVEISRKIDDLKSVQVIKRVDDYATQYREIAKGLSSLPTISQKSNKNSSLPYDIIILEGKRYAVDTVSGALYPVDETTKSFCVPGGPNGKTCYVIKE